MKPPAVSKFLQRGRLGEAHLDYISVKAALTRNVGEFLFSSSLRDSYWGYVLNGWRATPAKTSGKESADTSAKTCPRKLPRKRPRKFRRPNIEYGKFTDVFTAVFTDISTDGFTVVKNCFHRRFPRRQLDSRSLVLPGSDARLKLDIVL